MKSKENQIRILIEEIKILERNSLTNQAQRNSENVPEIPARPTEEENKNVEPTPVHISEGIEDLGEIKKLQ